MSEVHYQDRSAELAADGILCCVREEYQLAKHHFLNSTKGDRNLLLASYYLGLISREEGDYTKAIAQLQSVQTSKNNFKFTIEMQISRCYEKQGNWDKVRAYLTDLKSQYSQANSVYSEQVSLISIELGRIAFRFQEWHEAIRLYEEAITQRPEEISVMNNLAVAYIHSGEMHKAKVILLRMMEMDPDNKHTLENMSVLEKIIALGKEQDKDE